MEMYNGDVIGEYTNLKVNEAIELKWKFKDWKAFANLVITFENITHRSVVMIYYTGVEDEETFKKFWMEQIFEKVEPVFSYHLRDEENEGSIECD